jgi:hypothetical protein
MGSQIRDFEKVSFVSKSFEGILAFTLFHPTPTAAATATVVAAGSDGIDVAFTSFHPTATAAATATVTSDNLLLFLFLLSLMLSVDVESNDVVVVLFPPTMLSLSLLSLESRDIFCRFWKTETWRRRLGRRRLGRRRLGII